MKLLVTTLLTLALPLLATAQTDAELNAFYAVEKNRVGLEKARRSGRLEEARTRIVAMCRQGARFGKDTGDCSCVSDELDTVSEKKFYFELATGYRESRALYEAAQQNDRERYDRILKRREERDNLFERIKQRCP